MKKHLVILTLTLAMSGLGQVLVGGDEQNGPIKQVINKLDDKAAQAAQTIETKMNDFVNPPPHIPGQSTMPVSASRGAGRLLRNMTVEGSRFVGAVAKGLLKLTHKTAGALATTARESGSRLIRGRQPPTPAPINIVVESAPVSSPEAATTTAPNAAPETEGLTSTTTKTDTSTTTSAAAPATETATPEAPATTVAAPTEAATTAAPSTAAPAAPTQAA